MTAPGLRPQAARALALAEWGVVVRALLAGEQILDLRTDVARDGAGDTTPPSTRVWLCPTVDDQDRALVRPAYHRWVDDAAADVAAGARDASGRGDGPAAAPPAGTTIRVEGWAEIVGVARLTTAEDLAKIEGKFVWTGDYATVGLGWKPPAPLWVLALRAHRLVEPITVARGAAATGDPSWIDLAELPDDPASLPSEPALSDEAFSARLGFAANDLPDGFSSPAQAGR